MNTDAIRVRVYIDGKVSAETWVASGMAGSMEAVKTAADHHMRLAMEAQARGSVWMVEMYDPDMPPARAYKRFGTDSGGTGEPVPYNAHNPEELARALAILGGEVEPTWENLTGRKDQ